MRLKKKESIGRQKIPIVKIENENHRQVTFSKRRTGLIKKASEISTLCGAEVAIIGFSLSEKPFAFGHESVESVLNRCLFQNNISVPQTQELQVNDAAIRELNVQLTQALSGLENEKKKKEDQEIEETRKESVRLSKIKGWENPVEEMNKFQLQEMKHEVEKLIKEHMAHTAHMAPVWFHGKQSNKSLDASSYGHAGQGYQQRDKQHASSYGQGRQGYQQDGYGQQSRYGQPTGYDQLVGHNSTNNPSQEEDTFKAVLASSAQSMQAGYGTSGQHPPTQGGTGQTGMGLCRSNPQISPIRTNQMINSSTGGGYPQQGGYQARQPSSWAPPGYGGYMQQAAYPGPPQYGQSVYRSYPQYGQTSSGYFTWDPFSMPPSQQSRQAEYDYYGQATGYGQAIGYHQQGGYNSQPVYNPSQVEDTFKAAPASSAQPGQAGYGTYGEHPPAQGSIGQVRYGSAPTSQSGNNSQPTYSSEYGAPPPASNTLAYGQSQQLSGAPGSYGSQSGYALPSVSRYGQAPHVYGSYGGYTQPNAGGGTPSSQSATPPAGPP